MKRPFCAISIVLLLCLVACGDSPKQQFEISDQDDYRTIDWVELIPDDDLDALLNPPDYLSSIEDGSSGDVLESNLQSSTNEPQNRYEQALVSTSVKDEFDQLKIRVPGFIVPLEFDDNSLVTGFFLVPFFGACIHEPPPPPNQIIYSEYKAGKKIDNIQDAVWITGTLTTALTANDLATSAYSMVVDSITPWDYGG